MSMKKPFEPHNYADYLKQSDSFASDMSILWKWTGTHWQPYEESEGATHAYHWLVHNDRTHVTAAYAAQAYAAGVRWLEPLPKIDERQVIIPVTNGYLHLNGNAVVLLPHDKSLGMQHVVQCEYQPNAPEPTQFKRFLERVLPDSSVRARVQEYIGYTFLADARFQRAQLWQGDGANGKGVLARIVQALHFRTASVQLDNMDGFNLSGVVGASLIYCDEAPQRNINEQLIKSLIAGETVQINRKFRDPLSMKIQGKWLVLANHFPAITDQSGGFWRRWDIVPFGVVIPERERTPLLAEQIIEKELGGVLNWAIEGLLRLLKRGAFDATLPAPMQFMLGQAKAETNSVLAWYEGTNCMLADKAVTEKAKVYQHYTEWCRANGMSPVASPKFWKRLAEVLGEGRLTEDRVRQPNGSQPRTCNLELPFLP
jgi:putative DNA primase/helicase